MHGRDIASRLTDEPLERHMVPERYILVPGPAMAQSSPGDDLRLWTHIILSRWYVMALVALVPVLLMIFFIWVTTPLYQSTAELLIDPRQRQILDQEIVPTGLGSSALGADTLLLDSQIEVIKSQSVLARVIEELRLTEDPEFVGTDARTPVTIVKDLAKLVVYGPQNAHTAPISAFDRALKKLDARLTVGRGANTYVVVISMRSADPEKAASIANRIAEIYVEETSEAVATSTREAATLLEARLGELRAAVSAAEQEVEAYRVRHGLIGAQDLLVVEQQLRDLNAEISRARIEANQAQSELRQAEEARAGAGGVQAVGRLVQSPVLEDLLVRLAVLESQEAELRATLLPGHPQYARLADSRHALEAAIDAELDRVIGRLKARHAAARENEQALAGQLADLEARTAQSGVESVRLVELERDASITRSIYESVLNRAKEARQQVELPSSTARLITRAFPRSRPDYPRAPLLLAASAGLGLMLALAVVWVLHVLSVSARRSAHTYRPAAAR